MPSKSTPLGILILAAGQGKRMKSPLPKVLHSLGGEPLLFHILNRVQEVAPSASVAIVVGHGREEVEATVRAHAPFKNLSISFIHQAEQLGTGHAAQVAAASPWGAKLIKEKADILVLPGDLPLLSSELVKQMLEPLPKNAALRLLTTELTDPTGYGRIIRRGKTGPVLRITEHRDANERERAIREVAASIYTFSGGFLAAGLRKLSNKNTQKEYYLTDLVSQASTAKKKIDVLVWKEEEDLRGINDPWELALAQRIMNQRIVKKWAQAGVKFSDPYTTQIDSSVTIDEGTTIGPGVVLKSKTQIGKNVTIGAYCVLSNMVVGDRANVKVGSVGDDSIIREEANVGPYAHLRPESEVGPQAKVGNFVELKKAKVGRKTSVAHLSYLGDAEVGDGVNIGCGFVTCNFDGRVKNGSRKHKTIIEDGVFIGSDCQVVAPITIKKGSYIASGSTITKDVPEDALGIGRSRQENKLGYAKRLRGDHS